MASVQVLRLQTSAHKEVSVGGCTDPTKTPQSFPMKTVWFQKWVCTRHHMPTFWSTTKNLLHELLFMGPLKLVGSHRLDRDPASVARLRPPKHWSV